MKIIQYIKLIRIKHWIKNGLIIIPAFFGAVLFDPDILLKLFGGFFVFSFYSSAVYVINDICDAENDRKHPVKCKRPIASGKVSVREAYVITVILLVFAVALSIFVGSFNFSFAVPLVYFIFNLLYCFRLKHKPIADIVFLVSGFFFRVFYGSMITNVIISGWLYLTVVALSMFMAFGKRRNEKRFSGEETRKVLRFYNESYLNSNMYMYLTLFAAFYSIWSLNADAAHAMIYTTPAVLLIMLRYTYLLECDDHGDPVEMICRDKVLLILGSLYAVSVILIIYFPEVFNEHLRF